MLIEVKFSPLQVNVSVVIRNETNADALVQQIAGLSAQVDADIQNMDSLLRRPQPKGE